MKLNHPVFLMNLPLSLSTQTHNNVWMKEFSHLKLDIDRAIDQFLLLYRHITKHAIVYLLPSTPGLQDQTYVSNLGVCLPHKENTIIISLFRAPARVGEDKVGTEFFRLLNFTVVQPPGYYFEGEADIKHIKDNLYVGAFGMRTSAAALKWMTTRFDMEIIPFFVTNPYLYHLDCSLFRINEKAIMLYGEHCPSARKELEKHCEIVDVSLQDAKAGITNCLLLAEEVLCDSNIEDLDKDHPKYQIEKHKIDTLGPICSRFGLNLRVFNMSEFYKSGALLSCLVMRIK